MRRRAGILLGVAVALAVSGVGAAWRLRPTESAAADAPAKATGEAKVTRQDLIARQDVDGTLGYGDEEQVLNQLAGTLTGAAAAGTTVQRGQGLYSVDNRMVPLFYGELPGWRRLAAGVADGPDVRQLEANLVALGYATEADLKVDDTFSAATATAIKRWQAALGVDQTGALDPGAVVYAPGAVRIKAVKEAKGASLRPGAPVLAVTGTARVVAVDLDASKQGLVKAGDKVEVRLPDGRTTPGTVTTVASVAKTSGGGQGGSAKTVLPVEISLDDPAAAGALDEAPVRVGIVTASRKGVLTVPVNALLALSESGYGVRAVDGAAPRIVPVKTGLFAKGAVEISGDGVGEGTVVEVPAQ